MNRALGFVAVVGVFYLLILLVFRIFEHGFIFFPNYPSRLSGEWHPAGLPVEDVWLQTTDGVKLHAWWIPAAGAEFTFVAFHGNAANIANRADVYGFLHRLPANVLAVEYRGYGRSAGSPGEAGLYLDAEAAYGYLTTQRAIAPARIVAFGQSLGAAVAADLAANHEVGGAVLEGAFPSARAVARRVYPFLPGLGRVVRSRFDIADKLSRVRAPVLIVHCARDPVIAFALGEAVFAAAREPRFFWRVEAACHEEASLAAPAQYRERLFTFLNNIKTTPGETR